MRLIILIVAAFLAYKFVKGLLAPRPKDDPSASRRPVVFDGAETALDPVCGSYVSVEAALTVRKGDKLYYFCGDDCRQKFLHELRSPSR
ncbi:MAG TPA: YHS domain-containing protein [Deltaproteobacteria bacterium]|nr:YHS domain-containing protein [Deltaproteobacteria bacterium]